MFLQYFCQLTLSRESYVTFHHEPFILLHKYFPLEILSVLSENKKLIPSKFHFWFPSLEKYRFENQSVSRKVARRIRPFIVFLEDPRFRRGEEETGTHRGGGEGRCLPEGSEKVVHGSSTRARVSTRSAVMIRAGAALKRCT